MPGSSKETSPKPSRHVLPSPTLVISSHGRTQSILFHKSKLLAVSGPLMGREFMISKSVFTIGAGEHNDLILDDATISQRHCEIEATPGGYVIRDLGSTNGTLVQGVRVTEAFLSHGTEVQLGKTKIVFCPLQETMEFTLSEKNAFGGMLGHSIPMRRVFHTLETYAPTDATILIEGETGTGKEILAEEIHRHSKRKDKPFIVIDCASLAKDLIASELFGHTKGAFTGATTDRVGAFEHANGGTVFLDEIGDLDLELQPKLLRVIEKREVRPVGSNRVAPVNVRIISATNRNLKNALNENKFREDLFYRISVVHIELPPLRRRKEDIPVLARRFLKEFAGEDAMNRVVDFDRTMAVLEKHEWPGNVRELRNLVEVACAGGQGPINLMAFLYMGRTREPVEPEATRVSADQPFKDAKGDLIRNFELQYVQQLLKQHNGNVSQAARAAGIERAYLQRLLNKHGLR